MPSAAFIVAAKKIDFQYSFRVGDMEAVEGEGSVVIPGNPEIERIHERINGHVSEKISDFINSAKLTESSSVDIEVVVHSIRVFELRTDMKIKSPPN